MAQMAQGNRNTILAIAGVVTGAAILYVLRFAPPPTPSLLDLIIEACIQDMERGYFVKRTSVVVRSATQVDSGYYIVLYGESDWVGARVCEYSADADGKITFIRSNPA